MKMTYLKLGWEKELNKIIEKDRTIGPIYHRTREIVNEIEGYQALVMEFK